MAPLEIITLPVGSLQTNCYFAIDSPTGQTVIIDPGEDAEYLKTALTSRNLDPIGILATHGHFDHLMAVLELRLIFEIPFYIHQQDEFLVRRLRETALHYAGFDPGPPPPIDQYLLENTTFPFGSSTFQLIPTPGHTPGSLSFYSAESTSIFVGDLVFAEGGVGRTDFAYSHPDQLQRSIHHLCALPENTIVYPGHGEPTSIAEIKLFTELIG